MEIESLSEESLEKTFKRLKKDTKRFAKLIVRDAVDYIDFEVDLSNNLTNLIYKIKNNSYYPSKPYFLNMPKNKGNNRPTVVLDICDAIVYRFCVEQIEDELLSKTRQQNIRGGIKITAKKNHSTGDDFYEQWFDDWQKHNENLKKSLERKNFLVATDIASYFENINILILKDSIRSDITGKNNLLNLLFYFLEHTKYRFDYEVNTFNGLLQEDIDASRLLAYYFLKNHDEVMANFCKENSAEYYRFVDDMSITVDNETKGRKALKAITESLRRLNLVASIEKTEILTAEQAKKELFFEENEQISSLQNELIRKLKNKQGITETKQKIISYYKKIKKKGSKRKNWIKILKRFYTLCAYGGFDLFSREIEKHIIQYPLLFSDTRIFKYVLKQESKVLNKIIMKFIDYLYSEENLYPQLETNLLELFLAVLTSKLKKDTIDKLKKLSSDIFFTKNNYKAQSDYAKALSCLLFFKLKDDEKLNEIANFFLKNKIHDLVLQKYIVLVSLCCKDPTLRTNILKKAKRELNFSLHRFINMIENAKKVSNKKIVKNYINKESFILYQDRDWKIAEKFEHIRGKLFKEILEIYS
ncbi:MAG: RNA-directed DNA polymerase [Candidatus Anstonellaceae archaeon]